MRGIKTYIIISDIIQIVFSIFLVVYASEFAYEYNSILEDDMTKYAISASYVRTIGITNIILNIIMGTIVFRKGIEKQKVVLIILSALSFLLSSSYGNIAPMLAVINVIVLACIKKATREITKSKFNIKEVEKSISVDARAMTKKEKVLAILLIAIYLLQLIPETLLPNSRLVLLAFIIILYIALFVIAILTFWQDIKNGFKRVIANFKPFSRYLLRVFGVMFALYYLAIITTFLAVDQTTSVNQDMIELLPLGLVAPIAIIWAPVVEEAMFRGLVRKVVKNNWLYIVVSGGVFGIMHTLGEATITLAIATAVPYAILGGAFAYIYAKTNNLTGCMIAHSIYNMLGVLLMTLK